MGGMSVSGLVSGLDTSNIIEQLLRLEREPQRRLQTRKSDIQNTISSFQELNTRFKTLRTAADDLTSSLDWRQRKVTSSDEGVVTAAISGTPLNGSLSFTVGSLSAAHSLVSGSTVAGTEAVVADGSDFTIGTTTITAAEYGGGTLAEVVDAINASDAGVSATAVQVSPGQYRLQLTATETGADGTFAVGGTGLTSGLGAFGIVSQGADASITVGSGPAAYQVTSKTNSFTDVIPGLTFTAKSLGTATLTVEADGEKLAGKVEALVKAMDDASKYVLERTTYDQASKKTGVFLGVSLPSSLRSDMVRSLIDPVSGSSLVGASVGIETTRDGKITFDKAKFLEAYAADPAAVESFFGANATGTADDGIAERLSRMAEQATALNTGRIAIAISGREAEVSTIDDRIESWDVRLELRETALRRQFSGLETALSRLQQQGQWLSGQLAAMPVRTTSR